ncbi:MAG: Hsp20 family protein [Hyphomonadaceae bacterium]|nr:Hsp20 family protein [Hyphomonadaceae bacterium]MBC6413209.1 Hsp20 family protein [Hyphomonadaceae bacterium]
MRTYDFSPLYRSFVGLDRMANLIDAASQFDGGGTGYPPYNVAQLDEDTYRIEVAVAGFGQDDLEIESHQNTLTITGRRDASEADDDEQTTWLHRGIAERGFERRFQLADHVLVTGAELKDGLLVVSLKREMPEALKPRKITIGSRDDGKLISGKSSQRAEAA